MNTSTLAALTLGSVLCIALTGCVDTRPMQQRAAMQALTNMANSSSTLPGGKDQPVLTAAEQAQYQAVVAHYRAFANNKNTFNTSNAIPCNVSQNTANIIAQNAPLNVSKSQMRSDAMTTNQRTTMSPITFYLLAGNCNGGNLSGPFEAIVRYSTHTVLPTNTEQNATYTARIQGELAGDTQRGQWQSVSMTQNQSEYFGTNDTSWAAQRYQFNNGQISGIQMIYAEFPQFNSLTVRDSPYGNEMRRVRTFVGSNMSNMYTMFQNTIYGWFYTYSNNELLGTSCMWMNQTVAQNVCQSFSAAAPLNEFVGVGVILPREVRGRFQVRGLIHPSAASEAGLTVGDTILAIDGVALTEQHDTTYVVDRLRGPEGSTVTLTVLFENATQSENIVLTRTTVRMPGY